MSAIRQPGRINEHTTLIDVGMYGVAGTAAVYLVEGERTCLIDGGTRTEARRIVKALKGLGAFPPDIVIATHAHYDHAQGIPTLRREAARQQASVEVLASEKAIPMLADPTYNEVFDAGPYESVRDVTPLREGESVDLGGITLRIYDAPGHSDDQIAILDEAAGNLFVGDALGIKVGDNAYLPPFMPPSWDPDAFQSTVGKLKGLEAQSLCLAHYGFIYGDEAQSILDEALDMTETWWRLFEDNVDRLDDVDYMVDVVMREIQPDVPDLRVLSPAIRALLGLMSGWRKLTGKRPQPIGELLLKGIIEMLTTGYRMRTASSAAGS